MNTSLMFSSADSVWETDPAFYAMLDAEFAFTLDACCNHDNAKCLDRFTEEENALVQD